MEFIVTVDTEADNQWKKKGQKLTLANILFLPRFQKLCEKYNFPPTYFITYEVATDERAVKMLGGWQAKGKAEIGAHLHPWTNPPFSPSETADSESQPFPSELSNNDLWLKLKILTQTIIKNFGQPPTSYRAGRFGFDGRAVNYLRRLGYLADCSVTPKISWKKTLGLKGGAGGPDFRQAGVKPYLLSAEDICRAGNSGLLEAPVSIIYTGSLIKENSFLSGRFTYLDDGLAKNILNKILFKKKWLRIFQSSKIGDWSAIYKAAVRNKLPVLEFMIHSSELMPGGSPYAKDEKEVEKVYFQLEAIFKLFKSRGVEGVTLSAFAKNYDRLV